MGTIEPRAPRSPDSYLLWPATLPAPTGAGHKAGAERHKAIHPATATKPPRPRSAWREEEDNTQTTSSGDMILIAS